MVFAQVCKLRADIAAATADGKVALEDAVAATTAAFTAEVNSWREVVATNGTATHATLSYPITVHTR